MSAIGWALLQTQDQQGVNNAGEYLLHVYIEVSLLPMLANFI